MIRPEDVADLREGDVVELVSTGWPEGTVVRGPLWLDGETLQVGHVVVRHWDGKHPFDRSLSLTVVSRAPRPLYTNSERTEAVSGDVARDENADGIRLIFRTRGERFPGKWIDSDGIERCYDGSSPSRLRLLVDGETGQQVGPDPAAAWDEGFEAAAEWIRETNQSIDPPRNPYETGQVVQ